MIRRLFLLPLLFLSAIASAQVSESKFELWNSQTFAAPYSNDVIATSNEILNVDGYRVLEVVIHYEALTPDRCCANATYSVSAVVEVQASDPNKWYPLAYQFTGINDTTNGSYRIIYVTTQLAPDDVDQIMTFGTDNYARKSINTGSVSDRFRVRLLLNTSDPSADLTSITVSGYGRLLFKAGTATTPDD